MLHDFVLPVLKMKIKRGSGRNEPRTLTQDTHQQTIILREMMCARSKLEEDNQQLRDKLQDAEMLIHLLRLKLEQATGYKDSGDETGEIKSTKTTSSSALPSSATLMLGWRQTRKPAMRKRDAFKNSYPPGRRTFEPPTKPTVADTSGDCAAMVVPQCQRTFARGIGRSEILQNGSSRMESTRKHQNTCEKANESYDHVPGVAPSEYTYESAESINEESMDAESAVTEEAVMVSRGAAPSQIKNEPRTEDGQKMRSVIGMLADSVINEYSTKPYW